MTVALLLAIAVLLAAVALLTFALQRERTLARASAHPAPTHAAARSAPADVQAVAAEAAVSGDDGDLRPMLGLLAHELRTPLGAIIGYQELLLDGLLGPLPDKAEDAIRRIGTSSAQLRHLIDGLCDLVVPDAESTLELQQVATRDAAVAAAESARTLAAGRSVKLEVVLPDRLPSLVTDLSRLAALLDLAVGAAVRASPGRTLTLTFSTDVDALVARVDGTALDPARDRPRPGREIATGVGLRLAMAARMARLLGGDVALEGAAPSSLLLRVPPAPIDAVSGLA